MVLAKWLTVIRYISVWFRSLSPRTLSRWCNSQ